jgi:peptide/nickel transport system substrate-binding protein
VTIRIMPDDAARAAALRNGSVDVTTFQSPDSTRLLKGQAGVRTVVQSTTDYYRLDVNAISSIFRDERLRQALALSIDRNRIRDVALAGVGRPTAAVSAAFGGVCDPAAMQFATPDVQRARQLVQAAGAVGKPVEIVSLPIIPMGSPIAQVLQQNLQAAGFKVTIKPLEIGQAIKQIYSGKSKFDMAVSWFAGYGDPAMVLPWWDPAVTSFAKGYTKPDPDLQKLIESGLSTAPGPARTKVLGEACNRIANNVNVVPLVSKDAIVAYRSDKISAVIPPVEGYAVPLRHLAEFAVKRS